MICKRAGIVLRQKIEGAISFGLAEVIENFVFEDAEQPAFFRRSALVGFASLKRCNKSTLDNFFRGGGIPHSNQSIAVQGIAIPVYPKIAV